MAIIINYDLPDNITVNILPTGETVVNVLPKSPIVVNLCNDNGQSTTDYAALTGKPKINDVELIGNKTLTQLGIEPKRGDDDFYLTNAEKTQGALATGNSELPTVKDVADRADRLLVDFTVPTDRLSVDFVATDSGVLFSDLSIRAVTVLAEGYLINDTVSNMLIGINGLYSETGGSKYQLGPGDQAAGFLIAVRRVFSVVSYLYVNGQNCNTVTSNWRATDKNPLTNPTAIIQTGNKFNNCNGKITAIRITCSTPIKAGTNFTIYRND